MKILNTELFPHTVYYMLVQLHHFCQRIIGAYKDLKVLLDPHSGN